MLFLQRGVHERPLKARGKCLFDFLYTVEGFYSTTRDIFDDIFPNEKSFFFKKKVSRKESISRYAICRNFSSKEKKPNAFL